MFLFVLMLDVDKRALAGLARVILQEVPAHLYPFFLLLSSLFSLPSSLFSSLLSSFIILLCSLSSLFSPLSSLSLLFFDKQRSIERNGVMVGLSREQLEGFHEWCKREEGEQGGQNETFTVDNQVCSSLSLLPLYHSPLFPPPSLYPSSLPFPPLFPLSSLPSPSPLSTLPSTPLPFSPSSPLLPSPLYPSTPLPLYPSTPLPLSLFTLPLSPSSLPFLSLLFSLLPSLLFFNVLLGGERRREEEKI